MSVDIKNSKILSNIYRRYIYIRLLAMREVLEIMLDSDSLHEASMKVLEIIHKEGGIATSSPIEKLCFLPNKPKKKDGRIFLFESVFRQSKQKKGL